MLSIDAALARVPQWRTAVELQTSYLTGGITNKNYRVDADGVSSVLRVTGANTELLGIDRHNEYAAALAAAEIGVAPEVVYFIEPEGWLVTRYINGRSIPRGEMLAPETVREVAHLLLRIHGMRPIPGSFSPFRVVESYHQLALRLDATAFPAHFEQLLARMGDAERALDSRPFTPHPCHNDLLDENFLREDTRGQLYVLDWEYAGMGDPQFDLANLAAQHEFAPEHDQALLESYFGSPTPHQLARHTLLRRMSDFREAMWGVAQLGLSTLDFDFEGYSQKYFERLTAGFADQHFAAALATLV